MTPRHGLKKTLSRAFTILATVSFILYQYTWASSTIYRVQKNDTLSEIAQRLLPKLPIYADDGGIDRLIQANPDKIQDPNQLKPGLKLKIPQKETAKIPAELAYVSKTPEGHYHYRVQPGDTLTEIAAALYPDRSTYHPQRGTLKEIHELNPSLKEQAQLYVGQSILLKKKPKHFQAQKRRTASSPPPSQRANNSPRPPPKQKFNLPQPLYPKALLKLGSPHQNGSPSKPPQTTKTSSPEKSHGLPKSQQTTERQPASSTDRTGKEEQKPSRKQTTSSSGEPSPGNDQEPAFDAYSKLKASPVFSFTRYRSTDQANGSEAIISSNLNYGVKLSWEQIWTSSFETSFEASLVQENYASEIDNKTIKNHQRTEGELSFLAEYLPSSFLTLRLGGGFLSRSFFKASDPQTLNFVAVPSPGVQTGIHLNIPLKDEFSLGVKADGFLAAPQKAQKLKTRLGKGVDLGLGITQSLAPGQLKTQINYQRWFQNTTLTKQIDSELSFEMAFSLPLGRQKAKEAEDAKENKE